MESSIFNPNASRGLQICIKVYKEKSVASSIDRYIDD